jgi:hypothetical protein
MHPCKKIHTYKRMLWNVPLWDATPKPNDQLPHIVTLLDCIQGVSTFKSWLEDRIS